MDAFYASVEQRDDPALRGRPVIVGGHAHARRRAGGVVRGAAVRRAQRDADGAGAARWHRTRSSCRRVPRLRRGQRRRCSTSSTSVTPLVEPLSLDEAFLDVTASARCSATRAEIARSCADASPTRAAADRVGRHRRGRSSWPRSRPIWRKPNGQLEVPPGGGAAFLAPLPVARLWGVGPEDRGPAGTHGAATMGDIARQDPEARAPAGAGRARLWELASGSTPAP